MLSAFDVGTSEALFVATHECTSDSHMSNSFTRGALLSLMEYLHEVICRGTFADSGQKVVASC